MSILALAALLRVWALDIKPAHFDEGVNGWFADQMTQTGYFRYDPTNYHGPLHFHAVFISQTLLGRNLWALRLPAVLASLLAVFMLLKFERFFGWGVSGMAALLMAVSPASVFYGRYSIHESWMALFLIILLYGLLGLWQEGTLRFLWWSALGLTGMILTKETYIIHVVCFLLAAGVLWLWQKVLPSVPTVSQVRQRWTRGDLINVIAASALVVVAFYSGFFFDFGSVNGLWESYAAWFQTGMNAGGHEKTTYEIWHINYYWLALMARYEWGALFGLVACAAYVGRSDARIRYTAIYGVGALVAFSIISYKTPWCIISLLWPFYLVAGHFLRHLPRPWTIGLTAVLVAGGLAAALPLNFQHFADDSEPYVYVQTYPDIDIATGPLIKKAKADPTFHHAPGKVILESYYPLPWILGDFTNIGYYHEPPKDLDAAFILTDAETAKTIAPLLRGEYIQRPFRLRSGVDRCVAFFRKAEFAAEFQDQGSPDVVGKALPSP